MMRIEAVPAVRNLHLKDAGLFTDRYFCFEPGLNVLSGGPASGKTTILSALVGYNPHLPAARSPLPRAGSHRGLVETELFSNVIRRPLQVKGKPAPGEGSPHPADDALRGLLLSHIGATRLRPRLSSPDEAVPRLQSDLEGALARIQGATPGYATLVDDFDECLRDEPGDFTLLFRLAGLLETTGDHQVIIAVREPSHLRKLRHIHLIELERD